MKVVAKRNEFIALQFRESNANHSMPMPRGVEEEEDGFFVTLPMLPRYPIDTLAEGEEAPKAPRVEILINDWIIYKDGEPIEVLNEEEFADKYEVP